MDRVELCHKGDVVATHRRIWDKQQIRFEPIHYLALLERKPGTFEFARPLEGWALPECFATLRRLELKGGAGTREYIGVLRLLDKHPLKALTRDVESISGAAVFARPPPHFSSALHTGKSLKVLKTQSCHEPDWLASNAQHSCHQALPLIIALDLMPQLDHSSTGFSALRLRSGIASTN